MPRYYDVSSTPQAMKSLWDKVYDLSDQVATANATITAQAATIASLQSTVATADQNAKAALIAVGQTVPIP